MNNYECCSGEQEQRGIQLNMDKVRGAKKGEEHPP
tara:strand:- start:474 stop:578 length:105 start_codon:yes stop_codon:yes gene_type:complete